MTWRNDLRKRERLGRVSRRLTMMIAVVALIVIALIVTVGRHLGRVISLEDRRIRLWCAVHAVLGFDEIHHRLPSLVSRDPAGRELGSWRMAVCPFLENFPPVDVSKAWDDPPNRSLASVPVYPFCFNTVGSRAPETCIVAVAGPDTAFDDSDVRFSDLPNDLIVVVETAPCGIPWIVPGDIDINRLPDGFTSGFDGQGFFVGFRDRTVWYLDKTVPVELVRQFCTNSGASALDRDTCLRQFVRFGDTDR